MKNRKMSITMKVIVSIAAMALLMLAVLCMSGCSENEGVVFKLSETKNYYIVTDYKSINGEIFIPQSYENLPVKEIADGAFMGCKTITGVTIPGSVRTIGKEAFSSCSNLKNVTILSGTKIIQSRTFQSCSSLASITIPSSVTSIEEYAFSNCTALTSITIPSSVTSIGEYAFV